MKINEYAQMMGWLTRPARQKPRFMAHGGRIGFQDGTKNRPKISGVDFKKVISDSFEKISNQKGKVSISNIVSDTGYSKPTIYKYLSENQSTKLIGQPTPVTDRITKEVNQIIDDVVKNKKPLINASPNKIFEKVYGKKFNIKTDNTGVIKKILNENSNWPKIRDAVTNTSTRVGAGNKVFETVKIKDFDKTYAKAIKSRGLTRAGTVEEFILRDLKRHIDQGGTKFKFAKGNSLEKGFKGLKIKDLNKGDIIDFEAIKKNDLRFKEYKKVFKDIKELKLKPYTNPITKEKTTLLKGLQEGTGIDAPLHIQHAKGVAVDPLKNLSIATHKANIGAKMVGSVKDVETLGVRSTIPGGKRVYGPALGFEDEVNRLTKFSDRMIKGAGTRTLKTPTQTLALSKITNYVKDIGCPGKATGGRISFDIGGSTACITRGLEKLKNPTNLSPGDQANIRALREMGKGVQGAKTFGKVARLLGKAGVVGELAFGGLFALTDYAGGANKEEILSNFTYGLAGKSMDEQLKEKDSLYGRTKEIIGGFTSFEDMLRRQKDKPIGRMSLKPGAVERQRSVLAEKIQPFMEGPRNEEFSYDIFAKQQAKDAQALIDFENEKIKTKAERQGKGILAADDWYMNVDKGRARGYAEGGIASLMKK